MFCLGGFWQGGFCPGVFWQGGFCPGVYVRGFFVWGVFVLEPSFIEEQRCDGGSPPPYGKTLIQELSIYHLRDILMNSLFVDAVDNRNKNMASINKTMWNYNSMVEV